MLIPTKHHIAKVMSWYLDKMLDNNVLEMTLCCLKEAALRMTSFKYWILEILYSSFFQLVLPLRQSYLMQTESPTLLNLLVTDHELEYGESYTGTVYELDVWTRPWHRNFYFLRTLLSHMTLTLNFLLLCIYEHVSRCNIYIRKHLFQLLTHEILFCSSNIMLESDPV